MAWMIKAGKGNTGQGAMTLSIESTEKTCATGWRFVSTPCQDPDRHPHAAATSTKQAWQDVLAQLAA